MANEFVIKNGYFSQGNSNVTGSLSVTQNVTASKALFSSSGVNQLMVLGSGSSSWLTGIYGSQGNLLTVTDTMSGSLFTVADISGYPIFKVISDHYTNSIQMIGTASLTGSLSITENLTVGQNITASKALISSSGNEQLMVMGSGSDSWITGIYGSQGNLLTVTDTMSGSLFTVADISGYPVLKVISDHYTNNVQIVGDTSLTGSLSITQNLTASKALISSSGNEQLMVMGSGSSSWVTGIYGSQGNLLTVTDAFSGSIFTVTDISGYPILDVTSDYYTGSIYLPTLQSQSQQNVVVYDSQSGLLSYVTASALGGGGGGSGTITAVNAGPGLSGGGSSGAVTLTLDTSSAHFTGGVISASLNLTTASFGVTIDGSGGTITVGQKGYVQIPYACIINSWRIIANTAGSTVIDVWKTAAPTIPTVANSITGSAPPTLTAPQQTNASSTLTGWTTSVAADDIIGFNVNSATTVSWVTLQLFATKT